MPGMLSTVGRSRRTRDRYIHTVELPCSQAPGANLKGVVDLTLIFQIKTSLIMEVLDADALNLLVIVLMTSDSSICQ